MYGPKFSCSARALRAYYEGREKCMSSKTNQLQDDLFFENSPKFKASSLGKLGEALKKHIQEYPDVLVIPSQVESEPRSEDI